MFPDNTIIFGNNKDEKYFDHNKKLVKEWLKVKEEYDTYEYMDDDVCVLNYRGGEYVGFHELYLTREYWLNAYGKHDKDQSKHEICHYY